MCFKHRRFSGKRGGIKRMRNDITIDQIYVAYLDYREFSGLKRDTGRLIPSFINTIKKRYNTLYLTKEMVDAWCCKHETETPYSHMQRVSYLCSFLRFARERDYINFDLPRYFTARREEKPPYAFTREGLSNFFRACDEYESNTNNRRLSKLNSVEIPVFFRLLYSSGMRTTEARLLLCEDIDLDSGIVSIRHTKGYDQHTVVLHDSMLALLQQYDQIINTLMPCRRVFFPTLVDEPHKTQWVCSHFNEAWKKYNDSTTVAYQLRHNYAIENINSWMEKGFDVHDRFIYLSKSMGHTRLEDTLYYYGIVPRLYDIIENISADKFNKIIPEIEYEE